MRQLVGGGIVIAAVLTASPASADAAMIDRMTATVLPPSEPFGVVANLLAGVARGMVLPLLAPRLPLPTTAPRRTCRLAAAGFT